MKTLRTALLIALCSTTAFPQATSQIQGSVQDATGAAVPGAEVKATQIETGIVRIATTSAEGTYVLANLPIGPYRLEVTKQGFAAFEQTGIVLQVNTNPTIDFRLTVGAISEKVQVEANAAQVELQTTSVGNIIENQRILELPLNGRNAAELVQLTGASIPAGVTGSGGATAVANLTYGAPPPANPAPNHLWVRRPEATLHILDGDLSVWIQING